MASFLLRYVPAFSCILALVWAVDRLSGGRLFGFPYVYAPGVVWMRDQRRILRAFYYTHWRQRSLFRGREYKEEAQKP